MIVSYIVGYRMRSFGQEERPARNDVVRVGPDGLPYLEETWWENTIRLYADYRARRAGLSAREMQGLLERMMGAAYGSGLVVYKTVIPTVYEHPEQWEEAYTWWTLNAKCGVQDAKRVLEGRDTPIAGDPPPFDWAPMVIGRPSDCDKPGLPAPLPQFKRPPILIKPKTDQPPDGGGPVVDPSKSTTEQAGSSSSSPLRAWALVAAAAAVVSLGVWSVMNHD